ncbi:MAG: hypothetical protein GY726_17900 [Proteobacteria bacterium]|nr:hypothetical protein [Pseudomonadota bacterium]
MGYLVRLVNWEPNSNFRQIAEGSNVVLHPVVSAVADPEVLKKLVVKGNGE